MENLWAECGIFKTNGDVDYERRKEKIKEQLKYVIIIKMYYNIISCFKNQAKQAVDINVN